MSFMDVILLGTSAACPTKYRSSSAIAVKISGETLLFDCGEGTQVQFQKARLKPGQLQHIFITHLHGDHIYGLIGLLTSLQLNARDKPIDIYGPQGLTDYLKFMQELSNFSFSYELNVHELDEESESFWQFENYSIRARPLEHRLFTVGYRIETKHLPGKFDVQKAERLKIPEGPERRYLTAGKGIRLKDGREILPEQVVGPDIEGKKLAICLDTRPCRNAVELAADVDLLIHDGTFEAEKSELADETGHSTVVQAAGIAKQANVKQLILTHISQRYQGEEDRLLESAREIFSNTTLAQDLMQLQL